MTHYPHHPAVIKRLFTLSIFIVVCISGCEPPADLMQTFVIRKNEHYSTPRLVEFLQGTRMAFEARFDASAIYDLGDIASQSNKNKLLGFADCNSQHHENSARFAWQWFDDRLEIYAYCYVDGQRMEQFLGTVPIDTFVRYEIELSTDSYIFRLNDDTLAIVPRGQVCRTGIFYKLWPYFGGSVPAPHDVRIQIRPIFLQ